MSGKGWTVDFLEKLAQVGGKPWQGRAWDPKSRKYRSKCWKSRPEATAWAKDESARMRVGLSQAGKTPIQTVLEDYIESITDMGAAPPYIAEQERTIEDAIKHGVTDLRHPRVDKSVGEWLKQARALRRHTYTPTADGNVLKEKSELSPRTRNRYLETMRTLANFAMAKGLIARNPFLSVKMVKQSDTLKDVFMVAELQKLVDAKHAGDPYYLLFCTLVYTGMRLGEAAHLRWETIEWKANRIMVKDWSRHAGANPKSRLKFKKDRVIPLQAELAATLKSEQTKHQVIPTTGWVFPDELRFATTKSHGGRFENYLKTCDVAQEGMTGRRTPHSTRHTYLSIMLATGENELAVMIYAGHNELSTTHGYTRTQIIFRDEVKAWERGLLHLRAAQSPCEGQSVAAVPKIT